MAIGIAKGFSSMDLALLSRLMQFYSEQPGSKLDAVGQAVGLNRPKINGLNRLMGYLRLQQRRKLTRLGELVLENDRYLRDLGTLCVFHYLLSANKDAEVWYFASNQFIPRNREFSRDGLNRAIDEAGIGKNSTKQLGHDKSLLLNAYTSEEYQALQSVGYLIRVEGRNDRYRAMAVEKVPALVLGFALYDRRATVVQTQTISINNLLILDGQVGKVFLLRRKTLLDKLKQLEARGVLGITQVADLDNITFTQVDEPLSLLADYYRERS
jgi:hypothetical protein